MAKSKYDPSKLVPAFTIMRNGDGWSFVSLLLDPDWNVVDYQMSNPDMRAIAQEQFKISVGKHWAKIND